MPATPYLRVDPVRLRENVRRAAEWADANGVALRPHGKTHKSAEVARLQLDHGAVGLTVATVGEAEAFAEHGSPTCSSPTRSTSTSRRPLGSAPWPSRAGSRSGSTRSRAPPGPASCSARHGVEVLVEVDSGQHRTGCQPAEAGAVAAAAARAGGRVRGVFTFPGHSYAPDALTSAADDEARALAAARDCSRGRGARGPGGQRGLHAEPRAHPTPTCSPRPVPASTCSATRSSGSSAPCHRSRSP